ncbi:MAG: formate dehydrogenase subunit gamma [Candidatus Hydrogenedentota bacterium]
MRSVLCLTAFILTCTVLAAAAPTAAEAPADAPEIENFDKYIGRDLVTDHRASKADLIRILPLACPPFHLKDEAGNIIDPTKDQEDTPAAVGEQFGIGKPVSPRQTCGTCHDYDRASHGYHFQTGFDEMFDEPTAGESRSVHRSPGFFGKWQLLYQRELAPKHFDDPENIDMTPFEWVVECGVCHPGGGPAEFDRAGRRYDETLEADRGLAFFGDSDYLDSPWDKTGVVEPDCFICHLDGYEYSVRAQQLKKLNFKWAATAGTTLGYVWGSVAEGKEPNVYYQRDKFMADGKVHLPIIRPGDRQCLYCHDISSVQKRGSTWHQSYQHDVHTNQGLTCTQCHTNDIRHNFAKGDSLGQTVRDDLDDTALSCKECHEQEVFGAPDYEHEGLPALHLERIGCEACHIVSRPFVATQTVDTTQGDWRQLPFETDLEKFDSWIFGAMWGVVRGQFKTAIVDYYDSAALQAMADTVIGPDSPLRDHFKDTQLPEGAFTVRELVEERGLEAEEPRVLALLLLEQRLDGTPAQAPAQDPAAADGVNAVDAPPQDTASAEMSAFPVCVFRGKAYRYYLGDLKEVDAALQPKRPGATIAESKFTFAKYDGMVQSEGSQVAAYWVYIDGDHVRPVFLKDMKKAWDFLHDEEYRIFAYPGETAEGEETPAWPSEPVPEELVEAPYEQPTTSEEAQAARDKRSQRASLEEALSESLTQKLLAADQEKRWKIAIHDDTNNTFPEVNTAEEMKRMAWALKATTPRLEGRTLYFIRGTRVFEVAGGEWINPYEDDLVYAAGTIEVPAGDPFLRIDRYEEVEVPPAQSWEVSAKTWERAEMRLAKMFDVEVTETSVEEQPLLADFATRQRWTASHGVEPAKMALGTECTDCHGTDSHFYFGPVVTDPFTEDGPPATTPMYAVLGYSLEGINIGIWREAVLKPWSPWIVLAVLALILLHFAIIGIKRGSPAGTPDVVRFRIHERLTHLVAMVTVAFLAITGFFFLLGKNDPLGHWARPWHAYLGYVASAGVVVMIIIWFLSMLPAKGDWKWLSRAGGYLGGVKDHLPAGKFNAGQKMLFWLVVICFLTLIITGVMMGILRDAHFEYQELVYTVHDVAGLVMIVLLMAHVYLATIVVPHSLNALFGGKVSHIWAKEHHPDWKCPDPETNEEAAQ